MTLAFRPLSIPSDLAVKNLVTLRIFNYLIILVAGVVLIPFYASAQISLEWPYHDPNVSSYLTPDECIAASARLRFSSDVYLVARDTLPAKGAIVSSLPESAVKAARECSARFDPHTISLDDYLPAIRMFLMADRDEDAFIVERRRLSESGAESDTESDNAERNNTDRGIFLAAIAQTYMDAIPVRFEAAHRLVAELRRPETNARWQDRFAQIWMLMHRYRVSDRMEDARIPAQWLVALPDEVTSEERTSREFQSRANVLLAIHRFLARDQLLDSLSESTESYLALQQSLARKVSHVDQITGTEAIPVEGDFWFPQEPSSLPPFRGAVNLLIIEGNTGWPQRSVGAMLRRLKSEFPNLEIVLAVGTKGFFGASEPPTPEEEAVYFDRLFRGFHSYPVTLSVTRTPFWRLPAPDKRRINIPTSNLTNYGGQMLLIDRDGLIVHHTSVGTGDEQWLTDLVRVLVRSAK